MKRMCLALVAALWCVPALADDYEVRQARYALEDVGRELRGIRNQMEYDSIYGGRDSRGGGGGGSGIVLGDGLVYHPYYFTKKAAKERTARETRYNRAQASREKREARRLKYNTARDK